MKGRERQTRKGKEWKRKRYTEQVNGDDSELVERGSVSEGKGKTRREGKGREDQGRKKSR